MAKIHIKITYSNKKSVGVGGNAPIVLKGR